MRYRVFMEVVLLVSCGTWAMVPTDCEEDVSTG
jgi:hypothetical protein